MKIALLLAACVASGLAFAQKPVEFDVATVRPAAPSNDGHTHSRISTDTETGKLNYLNVTLKDIIGQAYKVQQYQIKGPDWISTERFDIVAQFPPRTDARQVPLMLQSLLKDRFKLTTHRESKQLPVYDLVVAKGGPKFKAESSESGITSNTNGTHWHVSAKVSMRSFANFLSEELDRPVIDKTGLAGSYDFTIDWAADNAVATNDAGPSIFTAVQEQLGLRLESAKGPVEIIVVDHAERTPVED